MIANKRTSTLALTANGVSQSAALPGGGGEFLSLFNRGPQDAFVEISGDANMPASVPSGGTAGSFLVAANQPAITLLLSATDTHVAYVSAGNSTLYASRGKAV